jgi:hypothetical protein
MIDDFVYSNSLLQNIQEEVVDNLDWRRYSLLSVCICIKISWLGKTFYTKNIVINISSHIR